MQSNAQDKTHHLIVAVSGASGAVYGEMFVRVLSYHYAGKSSLMITEPALRVYRQERFPSNDPSRNSVQTPDDYLQHLLSKGDPLDQRNTPVHEWSLESVDNLGAASASGSAHYDGMVVVPCSMKTLSSIAHGSANNLLERAADVSLKERRKLILVLRESPLSLIHLKNMVGVTEAGAILLPASPPFYQRPAGIDDLALFMTGRTLDLLHIKNNLYTRWQGDDEVKIFYP